MKHRRLVFLVCLLSMLMGLSAEARERRNFDDDWRFVLGDSAQMAKAEYNDSWWRRLDVPHDWAIEGDFYVKSSFWSSTGSI